MKLENKVQISQLIDEHDDLSELFTDQFDQLLNSFEGGYPIFTEIRKVVNQMIQKRLKEIAEELEPL